MTVDLLDALTSPRIWTLDDLGDLPDGRYEIVDGRLIHVAAPGLLHEYGVSHLIMKLGTIETPETAVLGAPGIAIDFENFRVPDAIVIWRRALRRPHSLALDMSDVVLVVEVMSPTSRTTDRVTKPVQYASAGLRHLWRFEPEEALLLTFEARDGVMVETGRAQGDEPLAVTAPFAITIVPSELLP